MSVLKKNILLLFIVAFCIPSADFFGQINISGKVYDADTKEALPFVSILLKGTKVGTTTDFEGNYSISTSESSDSIICSYIGYLKNVKAIKKNVSQIVNIELAPNSSR